MANMKQDGSNITSLEFSTGRCRVRCEQCFVNYGQVGGTVLKNIMDPRKVDPRAKGSNAKWIRHATTVRNDRGELCWRPPRKGTKRLGEGDYGWKELTERERGLDWPILTDESAFEIPKTLDRLVDGPPRTPAKVGKVKGVRGAAGTMPWFLRVSSMSDSAHAPLWWLMKVLASWGDYCFFNASVVSACSLGMREYWESAFHKIVITANGGYQKPMPVKQFGDVPGGVPLSFTKGSMGERDGSPTSFLDPRTVDSFEGFGGLERQIKFYRLRALPTIAGRLETDIPVVMTQMRFLALPNALEFCRKYGITAVARIRSKKDVKTCQAFGVRFEEAGPDEPVSLRLRYNGRDNASPRRGEETIMQIESGFYRSSPDQWDHYPYVCDRVHGSCVACGLCASLDATQPAVRIGRYLVHANVLNVLKPTGRREGILMAPEPFGADYLPSDKAANYYASIFVKEGGRWVANPEAADEDWIAGALEEVAGYLRQGHDPDANACESWDTHEDVRKLTAFCYWNALKILKRNGVGFLQACEAVEAWFGKVTGAFVLDDVSELRAMWDGESVWTDEFGEV